VQRLAEPVMFPSRICLRIDAQFAFDAVKALKDVVDGKEVWGLKYGASHLSIPTKRPHNPSQIRLGNPLRKWKSATQTAAVLTEY